MVRANFTLSNPDFKFKAFYFSDDFLKRESPAYRFTKLELLLPQPACLVLGMELRKRLLLGFVTKGLKIDFFNCMGQEKTLVLTQAFLWRFARVDIKY